MARLLATLRRLLGARSSDLPGYGRTHLRRDLGMDDWEGSIGASRPDLLWPVRAPRRPSSRVASRLA